MSSFLSGWRGRTILFLVSQCVTLFGTTLVQMAMVWYVTLDTSSGGWVAALTVCAYAPQFLMSFVGGVWADRFSRKKLIIIADSAIALFTLALLLAMPYLDAGTPLLIGILIISALRSVAAGVQAPAVNAVIPQLVPEEHLLRFNGINATMQSVVQFAAPAAAGAILTFSTLSSTLLVDIGTAMVGVALLACVAIPRPVAADEPVALWADMKQGLRYAFSHKFISRLLAVYGLFIFLSVPAGFLAALLVSRVYGESYIYLTAVELVGFAGMAIGGLILGVWGGFRNRVKTLALGLATFGALAIGLGLSKVFLLYLVFMFIYGVALTVVQAASTTLIQERSDPAMQGRVFGLMGAMYSGFLPIGMVAFGPLADVIPLQWIMVGSGVALLLIAVACRLNTAFYTPPPAPEPSPEEA